MQLSALLLLVICLLTRAFNEQEEDAMIDKMLNDFADEDEGMGFPDPYGRQSGTPLFPGTPPPKGPTELRSTAEVEDFLLSRDDMPAVVGFFDVLEGNGYQEDYSVFVKLAERDGNSYRYAVVTNAAVLAEKKYHGCVVLVYPAKHLGPQQRRIRYPHKHLREATLQTFVRRKSPLAHMNKNHNEDSIDTHTQNTHGTHDTTDSKVSTDSTDTQVVTLTSDNFDRVWSAKDVLVLFHAPWCGHCRSLMPEFQRAAEVFKEDAGVELAAMDATAFKVPKGFDVPGYPSLYFVPAGSPPLRYDGGRFAEQIVEYVRKHRTTQG